MSNNFLDRLSEEHSDALNYLVTSNDPEVGTIKRFLVSSFVGRNENGTDAANAIKSLSDQYIEKEEVKEDITNWHTMTMDLISNPTPEKIILFKQNVNSIINRSFSSLAWLLPLVGLDASESSSEGNDVSGPGI